MKPAKALGFLVRVNTTDNPYHNVNSRVRVMVTVRFGVRVRVRVFG